MGSLYFTKHLRDVVVVVVVVVKVRKLVPKNLKLGDEVRKLVQ
jgi:hypothetical protein